MCVSHFALFFSRSEEHSIVTKIITDLHYICLMTHKSQAVQNLEALQTSPNPSDQSQHALMQTHEVN